MSIVPRLEQYTLKRPREVLLVEARVDGELDAVIVFKGFSSSLVRPTAFDPDVPVLPKGAKIVKVDRLLGPYDRDNPQYIDRDLSVGEIETLLAETGC